MNLDHLKTEWGKPSEIDFRIPKNINNVKRSKTPFDKLKVNMLVETIATIMAFLLMIYVAVKQSYSSVGKVVMIALALAMFLTIVVYLIYTLKFLQSKNQLDMSVKENLEQFIDKLHLGIKLYKIFNIALLPLGTIAGITISGNGLIEYYYQAIISGNLRSNDLLFIGMNAILILIVILGIHFYIKKTYGSYARELERTLNEFDQDLPNTKH